MTIHNPWVTSFLLAVAAMIGLLSESAYGRAPYKKEFEGMYVTDGANPDFVKAAEAAKCNICHAADSKNKKDRNAYGKALAKLLKKGDDKDLAKIKKSLESVAKEHSDPKQKDSPTFGELIKSGKLPGS